MALVVIGGVAAGLSAAARARRIDPQLEIVVLEKGQIRETGTHEEIVSHGGIYQRLHELQFEAAGSVVDL